jgi:hypothetical protein
MNIALKTLISGVILIGVSACAVSPEPQAVAQADIDSAEIGTLQPETRYVTVTGSRIRHRVSEDGTLPMTAFPVTGYTNDDVEFTGATNMQGALSILDPRID